MSSSPTESIAPAGNLSYVRGRTDLPLSDQTIGDLLADAVRRWPDRLAAVFRAQAIRWTWRDLDDEVTALAAGLKALGLQAGDRLGIWSPNRSEWVVTQFATARLGIVLVNINPAYRLAELDHALNVAGCRAIIAAEQLKSSMYLEMLRTLAPELDACAPGALKSARLPALQFVIRLGEATSAGMLNYNAVQDAGRQAGRGPRVASVSASTPSGSQTPASSKASCSGG